jgi:hypothetical protein
MSDHEQEETEQEPESSDLLEAQEGKGYGEDEGERESALDEEE